MKKKQSDQSRDLYEVLGVPRTADEAALRRAYRELARTYHPDTNKTAGAEARFREVQNAYEVLKDPERRRTYDIYGTDVKPTDNPFAGASPRSGRNGKRPRSAGPAPGGFDFTTGNPFADFFGQGNGRENSDEWSSPFRARRGSDIEAEVTITLREVALGTERSVTLRSQDGSTRTLEVVVPRGTTDGTVMRLAGQGHTGTGEGPAGDLLLKIKVAADPRFVVQGHDLATILPLAPWEAALGCDATVPTLDGDLTVTVPPSSSSGQKLRLRGKGLPQRSTGGSGDLLVELRIVLPKTLEPEDKVLYEALKERSNFQPRGA